MGEIPPQSCGPLIETTVRVISWNVCGMYGPLLGHRAVATSVVLGAELGDLRAGVADVNVGRAPNSRCGESASSRAPDPDRPGALLDVLGSPDCLRGSRAVGTKPGNVRNRARPKAVLTESTGEAGIEVPRDRAGTFEPQIVKKRQRRRWPSPSSI